MGTFTPDSTLNEWLLAAETPTIRYLTRRLLMDIPEADASIQNERCMIMETGPVPAILEKQEQNGAWLNERSFYTPKFTSTHWNMLLLTELCADPGDARIRAGAVSMIERTRSETQDHLEHGKYSWECLWANILHYSLYANLSDYPGVQDVVAVLTHAALENDWRCRWNGDQPCTWSAARSVWALAALPRELRTNEVESAIQSGLELLLERYRLYPANYPAGRKPGRISDLWTHLNFPLFYQADILLVLRILAEIGRLDHPGAAPALEWLDERRQIDGRWRGSNSMWSRTWKALHNPEETHRWVSLYAAWILKSA